MYKHLPATREERQSSTDFSGVSGVGGRQVCNREGPIIRRFEPGNFGRRLRVLVRPFGGVENQRVLPLCTEPVIVPAEAINASCGLNQCSEAHGQHEQKNLELEPLGSDRMDRVWQLPLEVRPSRFDLLSVGMLDVFDVGRLLSR